MQRPTIQQMTRPTTPTDSSATTKHALPSCRVAVQLVDAGGDPRLPKQPRELKPSRRGSRLIDRDVSQTCPARFLHGEFRLVHSSSRTPVQVVWCGAERGLPRQVRSLSIPHLARGCGCPRWRVGRCRVAHAGRGARPFPPSGRLWLLRRLLVVHQHEPLHWRLPRWDLVRLHPRLVR